MISKTLVIAGAAIAASLGAATAHPGSILLTAGGADTRTAMTSGVTFEETNGVHLYRGSRSADKTEGAITLRDLDRPAVTISIEYNRYVWRTIRRLRTQGFYSGSAPKSRPYTQGFWSGR